MGLLVGDGDFGQWTRVRQTPVIAADYLSRDRVGQ